MGIKINLGDLKVDAVENNSGVFSGKNYHDDWKVINKSNQGLGKLSGKKTTYKNLENVVNDKDTIDKL